MDWIKLDIALIKDSIKDREITDEELRSLMEGMPMMKNWELLISELLKDGAKVAIISGGLQQTAKDIAAKFPSSIPWKRRWGGIDRFTAERYGNGYDSQLTVLQMAGYGEKSLKMADTHWMILADIKYK